MTCKEFYSSIARWYDNIFPLNPAQLNFAAHHTGEDGRILDVGCATGELALALSRTGRVVTGIDLDEEMLNIARAKAQTDALEVQFLSHSMEHLEALSPAQAFHGILCMGNTLVHLRGPGEIEDFLRQVWSCLEPGGVFCFQIINYDRIIGQNLSGLPTIDNSVVRFERTYQIDSGEAFIGFKTRLTVKEDGHEITNEIPLYPLRSVQLKKMLDARGFVPLEFFGSFKEDPFTPDSAALVVVARKPV